MVIEYVRRDIMAAKAEAWHAAHNPTGQIPIDIELIIEKNLGMDIIPMPDLRHIYGADGFITSDLGSIYVDESMYFDRPNRYRFTLAHELSHREIHSEFFKTHQFASVAAWKELYSSIPDDDVRRLEFQANVFAGLLLMPETSLRTKCQEASAMVPEDLRASATEHELTLKASTWIAQQFEVSRDAMFVRIKQAGIII